MTEDQFRARASRFAQRVQPVYALLKWTWHEGPYDYSGYDYVPSVRDITSKLTSLWSGARQHGPSAASGGLRVTVEEDGVVLTFEMDEACDQWDEVCDE